MLVSGNQRYSNYIRQNYQNSGKAGMPKGMAFSAAVVKVEQDTEGIREPGESLGGPEGFLPHGLSFINLPGTGNSIQITASYAPESTDANPVVRVRVAKEEGEEYYDVDVNKVNPSNASELEMFAYCCHMDKQGMGTGGTFGSYHALKYYRRNSEIKGYVQTGDTYEAFRNNKVNWREMVSKMMKDYGEIGIWKQYQDGQRLLDMFGGEQPY